MSIAKAIATRIEGNMSNEITDDVMKDLAQVLQVVVHDVTDEASDSAEPRYMYAPFRRFIYNCAVMYIQMLGDMTTRDPDVLKALYERAPEEVLDQVTPMDEEQVLTRDAAIRLRDLFKPDELDEGDGGGWTIETN
jgi:hypothetical protein